MSKITLITFLTISDRYHNFYFVNFVYKMAAGGHFGCHLKITFDRISGHFRSIRNYFLLKFVTKWPPAAILDVRNSLLIHFLTFQINTELFFFFLIFDKIAASGHFGFPKITFNRISGHFRSIGHFGYPKFTLDRISGHFRSIQVFFCNFDKMAFWVGRRCQLSNSSEIFG